MPPEETRDAARAAWESLPETSRTPDQALGRWGAACGATWGVMERCDFSCTACYLAPGANRTRPLPFARVKEQLETMRARLGPGAKVQVTAGEVTLLPAADLARIVRSARRLGLVPMVMTHGQRFLREPRYLERLVVEGGLDRIAVHVDTTQRGRDGGDPRTERALMPVRARLAALVRDVRRRTGRPLHAAHTVTVTRDNLAEIPGVVRWTAQNADAFRLLALQPLARVGRTRARGRPDAVWARVQEGLGCPGAGRTWLFGHPDCNLTAFFWICGGRHAVPVRRPRAPLDDRFVRRLLRSGLAGWNVNGARPWRSLAGRLLRDPRLLVEVPLFCVLRLLGDARLVRRPRPFAVNVHRFMDEDELDTPRGRERLAACAFRVPVDGEMVPMCAFNGTGERARRVGLARR